MTNYIILHRAYPFIHLLFDLNEDYLISLSHSNEQSFFFALAPHLQSAVDNSINHDLIYNSLFNRLLSGYFYAACCSLQIGLIFIVGIVCFFCEEFMI